MAKARRTAPPSMRIRDFLAEVHGGVVARLGEELDGYTSRQRFGYLQYYRGDPGVHYEIWVQRKTQRLEIGLHFETPDAEWNYEAAAMLAGRAPEIVARIGPEYELEEWTRTWTRLHRAFAAETLTPELAADASERAMALMQGMEPIVEELLTSRG